MTGQPAIEDAKRTYHVLALSGGGYRALYSATILQQIEKALGAPLAKRFDLICGTSAGGILALGLASEVAASDLKALFEKNGRRIFGKPRVLGMWTRAKHAADGLRDVLTERFGNATLGDLKHRVLIPTVSFTTGHGQFFKTPHNERFSTDHDMRLVDVALATSAAPIYLPLSRNSRGVFADGGLVGNAPGMFGLHEVRNFLPAGRDAKIRVLAIGTMSVGSTVRGDGTLDRGLLGWKASLFDLVISAQASSVHAMLMHELGRHYVRIDDAATPDQCTDVKQLDAVTDAATNTLRDRGMNAAQRALGLDDFQPFKTYLAEPPIFFHGPNKNA